MGQFHDILGGTGLPYLGTLVKKTEVQHISIRPMSCMLAILVRYKLFFESTKGRSMEMRMGVLLYGRNWLVWP